MRVLAISVDDKEDSARMKRELSLTFPLLSDTDEAVTKRYGLVHEKGSDRDIARPANLLLDGSGVIRWAVFTDNIRVRPRPATVLEQAKALQ